MRELNMTEVEHVSGGTLGPGGGSDPGNLNRANNRFISSTGRQAVSTAAGIAGFTAAGAARRTASRVIGGGVAWANSP